MRPEVRALWAAALESGRFRRGVGRLTSLLRDPDGAPGARHCCLGVLCELAVEAGVELTVRDVRLAGILHGYRIYDGEAHFPPPAVLDWAGLDDRNPEVLVEGYTVTLGVVNDQLDATFPDVARLVRTQL